MQACLEVLETTVLCGRPLLLSRKLEVMSALAVP